MTLIRPLVTSLVKSNVSSIGGGGGGFPSDATLEHYYPFASNLTDSITGDIGTLTRASTSTVTDINTGNPITYGVDQPAFNGVGGTGDAIGLGFGASPDDFQLDSSTWPVNNCWYYLNFPNGIPDIGSDQYILEALLPDVANRFLLQAQASANIRVANIVAGSFITVISFPLLFNTPFDLVFNQNSVTGGQLAISSGAVGISAATEDLMIGGLAQVGATNTLTSALNSYVSQLKVGTGSVTLEQARNKT